jgi:hypothetical protein
MFIKTLIPTKRLIDFFYIAIAIAITYRRIGKLKYNMTDQEMNESCIIQVIYCRHSSEPYTRAFFIKNCNIQVNLMTESKIQHYCRL